MTEVYEGGSFVRNWLIDTLTKDVVTGKPVWFTLLVLSSLLGGWMFATTGSWLEAIRWDILGFFLLWFLTKIAEQVAIVIVKVLLLIIP
jgi:hypothetical protein